MMRPARAACTLMCALLLCLPSALHAQHNKQSPAETEITPAPPATDPASEDVEILEQMNREMLETWQKTPPFVPAANPELRDEADPWRPSQYTPPTFRMQKFDPDQRETPQMPQRRRPLTASLDLRDFDIPVVINAQVQSWIEFFTTRGKRYFRRYLERSGRWLPLIHEQLDARGLPRDLAYLSMIESGFTLHAKSWAGAVGPWQFMPATARREGLTVNQWVDERRDFKVATRAAAQHIAGLFKRFDDWYLALAAYNAGAGRISKAMKRYESHNYWDISQYEYLALETKLYVPKFIAAVIISHAPERFGFYGLKFEDPQLFDTVEIQGPATLTAIARTAGVSDETIEDLNPMFIKNLVPADGKTYPLRLPSGGGEAFMTAWNALPPQNRIAAAPVGAGVRRSGSYKLRNKKGGHYITAEHTVRFGDTLEAIAKRYGTSIGEIVGLNNLKSANMIHPGQKLVVAQFVQNPRYGADDEGNVVVKRARPRKGKPDPFTGSTGRRVHVLKWGETLSHLAVKYHVTIRQLKKWNRIKNAGALQVGRKIIVRP